MATDKDTLLSMGFDPARVEWALTATGRRGLQPAMDHILEHEGQHVPDPSAPATVAGGGGGDDDEDADALRSLGAGAAGVEDAKSIKCSQCGKVFRNTALANFHAEKSGHDQFEESTEEIKPLTEEEKKQRLTELRERMEQKRSRKAEQDLEEHKANELLRRKAAKDMSQAKDELKLKQAMKDAEEKRREKIADAKAKAAVKAQIEADKRARAEKAAREKALREGKPEPGFSTTTQAPSPISPTAGTSSAASGGAQIAGKDFKETRLQIRMASGGQPYTTTLSSDATLREVAEFLAAQNILIDVDAITLTQHFPRKVFSTADFSRTLKELGLTPSAVLIAS